jgi:triacylglycerol esterase/lipase EstA (alpha/beta hydrolase family)
MRLGLISLLLATSVSAFAASDYAREKKWAEEIVPGIVVGDPVHLKQKNGHKFLGIYTEATEAKMGVVVVHGTGIHPDWGMIGTLRQRLADLGFTTLSIQMPVLAVDAKPEAYVPTLPEAVERIQHAVTYLKAKGYQRIALVSHSMGSRMSHGYMTKNPRDIVAWAALGMPAALQTGDPITYETVKTPILDLYGSNDLPAVLDGVNKRKASLSGSPVSRQIVINDTDHFYAGQEEAMVNVVRDFLNSVK